MVDTHTHTRRSPDSGADPAEIVRRAKEAGLTGVVFTDHWDFGYESFNRDAFAPKDYARAPDLRALRTLGAAAADGFSASRGGGAERGGFRVLCGVEMSPALAEEAIEAANTLFLGLPFDYILLSAHYVKGVPQHEFTDFYKTRKKREAYAAYLEDLLELTRSCDDYDALAHYDYIARYAPYADSLMRYADAPDHFDALLKELASNGKALEMNTGRCYAPMNADGDYVDAAVFARFRELGGEFVCIGSDAHRDRHVGRAFSQYAGYIRAAGFKYAAHFAERKPVMEPV